MTIEIIICKSCSEDQYDCKCPVRHDSFQPSLDTNDTHEHRALAVICDQSGRKRLAFMDLCEAQHELMHMPKGWSLRNLDTGYSERNELAPLTKKF